MPGFSPAGERHGEDRRRVVARSSRRLPGGARRPQPRPAACVSTAKPHPLRSANLLCGRRRVDPTRMTAMSPSSATSPNLELKNVRKSYGDFVAVDGVSLALQPGVIFGLLGPNGAGKTT